jgi:hypothetical protein
MACLGKKTWTYVSPSSQDILSARTKNWEEIATQGAGSNCCVGVGARVSVLMYLLAPVANMENNLLVVLFLPCLNGFDSLRCNFSYMNRFVLH